MLQSASELPSATTRGRGAVSAKSAGRPAGRRRRGGASLSALRPWLAAAPEPVEHGNLQPLTAPPAGGVRPLHDSLPRFCGAAAARQEGEPGVPPCCNALAVSLLASNSARRRSSPAPCAPGCSSPAPVRRAAPALRRLHRGAWLAADSRRSASSSVASCEAPSRGLPAALPRGKSENSRRGTPTCSTMSRAHPRITVDTPTASSARREAQGLVAHGAVGHQHRGIHAVVLAALQHHREVDVHGGAGCAVGRHAVKARCQPETAGLRQPAHQRQGEPAVGVLHGRSRSIATCAMRRSWSRALSPLKGWKNFAAAL